MLSTKGYLATMKEWEKESREKAAASIAERLIAAGIIKPGQKEIPPHKIRDAFEKAYMPELLQQEGKGSTGGAGKFADPANRCLMREARGLYMPIVDLRCRPCTKADVNIYTDIDDSRTVEEIPCHRVTVEIKTGAGCLSMAGELSESWRVLIDALEGEKWLVWYPFSIQGWQDGDIETVDNAPYFFGRYKDLFHLLEKYNGDVGTWLKVCGNAINFQNVTSSGKKMAFLEGVCECGYDSKTGRAQALPFFYQPKVKESQSQKPGWPSGQMVEIGNARPPPLLPLPHDPFFASPLLPPSPRSADRKTSGSPRWKS